MNSLKQKRCIYKARKMIIMNELLTNFRLVFVVILEISTMPVMESGMLFLIRIYVWNLILLMGKAFLVCRKSENVLM